MKETYVHLDAVSEFNSHETGGSQAGRHIEFGSYLPGSRGGESETSPEREFGERRRRFAVATEPLFREKLSALLVSAMNFRDRM